MLTLLRILGVVKVHQSFGPPNHGHGAQAFGVRPPREHGRPEGATMPLEQDQALMWFFCGDVIEQQCVTIQCVVADPRVGDWLNTQYGVMRYVKDAYDAALMRIARTHDP